MYDKEFIKKIYITLLAESKKLISFCVMTLKIYERGLYVFTLVLWSQNDFSDKNSTKVLLILTAISLEIRPLSSYIPLPQYIFLKLIQ